LTKGGGDTLSVIAVSEGRIGALAAPWIAGH
jgi:hypothetical protein